MTVHGYVRVSTLEQNPERQVLKMRGQGVDEVYVDHASGRNLDRPEYARMRKALVAGDSIVLDSLDRLGRNYDDITAEWRAITAMGVDIRVLDLPFFDSARFREMDALGIALQDMLLSLLAYVAQTEREKNRQRQAEGIAVAKAEGRYTGRKPKGFPPETLAEASAILANVGVSAAADYLGVTRSTVYNMIRDGRLTA